MLKNMKINIRSPWGDTIDTLKYNKPLNSWYEQNPILSFNWFKLPDHYSFNIKEMKDQIETLLVNHKTRGISKNAYGKIYNGYKGLGFFARENATSPLDDHFTRRDKNFGEIFLEDLYMNQNLPDLIEDDFVSPTEIYNQYFKNIFAKFKTKITKASILELRSKGYLSSHVDYPYYKGIRLHAMISGGENSYYEVNGEKFQIPADGNWYFIDTGKFHSVWNEGPNNRLTININLNGLTDDPQKLSQNLLL